MIAAAEFRRVLGHVPTSVAVVTGMDGDRPVGFAVGTLCSVSLDPPLVSFCPARTSSSWPLIERGGTFCANVLGQDQRDLSGRFARGGDRFAGVDWERSTTTGAPLLPGALAWIECRIDSVHAAGDHLIVVGRVLALDAAEPRDPLVFYRRGYLGVVAA